VSDRSSTDGRRETAADVPEAAVANLRPGTAVNCVLVVKKKVAREQPTGAKFLLFQFSDRTGTINGVMWDGVENVDVVAGDLVQVEGDVQLYQNTRQIRVRRLRRADPTGVDLAGFLPTSRRDLEAGYARLLDWAQSVRNPHLRSLYLDLFHDPEIAPRFKLVPAGKGWHHAYVGGLLEHVLAMLEIGDLVCRQHPEVDRDLVIGGILLHDLGKIDEIAFRSHIDYTNEGRLVGHLVLGCVRVARAMDRIDDFPAELRTRVLHTIVSHHGSLDRGSPRPPMTLEATIVHLLDQLDSQAQGVEQVVQRTADESGWSEHVKLLDRFFFRGAPGTNPDAGGSAGG
jgi:3'-5' exoribonuclease